ncbi:MAG: pyridoxamine 5'-phosphate oxidase [Saprospiraceae bacterium]|jgi:pyridoxamine 5'-phosphate oxidase
MNEDLPLEDIRQSYESSTLNKEDLLSDPITMANKWLGEAIGNPDVPEPNTFTLATVDKDGQPSSRTLLIKGIELEGFIFYTNYRSRKGQELNLNPKAAILFFWQGLERQIRIEGAITKLDTAKSKAYFQSRPRESQVGAWASPQSEVIPDRSILDDRVEEIGGIYKDSTVLPKPPHWGGYVLKPHYLEFWQGRANRMHDRLTYTKHGEAWEINRLAP